MIVLSEFPKLVNDDIAINLSLIASIASDTLSNTPLPPLTEHTFAHAKRVEARAATLLTATNSVDCLNSYELYLLILSCWFHDSGLVYLEEGENPWRVRSDHGVRCKRYLEEYLAEYLNEFERELIAEISMSHLKSDVSSLEPQRCVELKGKITPVCIRPRLLASLLRVSDASDICQSRVSWRIAKHFRMNEESLQHWQRHLDIHAVYWDSRNMPAVLVVDGTYRSYESKRFLENAIDVLDSELALAKPYFDEAGLQVNTRCKRIIRERSPDRIISWSVLPRSVYKLLTEGIYESKTVHLRELVQNSLDAIKLRLSVLEDGFEPLIKLTIVTASGSLESKAVSLVIEDNGIGMDAEDVSERLIKIGATIRDSQLVKQLQNSDVVREELIARFGVGFVTVFAVAETVAVTTRKPEMTGLKVNFEGGDDATELFSEKNIQVLALNESIPLGTTVVVNYKEPLTGTDVLEGLEHFIQGWDQLNTKIVWSVSGSTKRTRTATAPDQWREIRKTDLYHVGDIQLHPEKGDLRVLQDGILVEENASDLLPAELGVSIKGCMNFPNGFLDLTSSRSAFRRNKRTVSKIRKALDDKLIQLQSELLSRRRRVYINRQGPQSEATVRALLDWSFSNRRRDEWIKKREREVLACLGWDDVGPDNLNMGLDDLLNRVESDNLQVVLVQGGGWINLHPVAVLSKVRLYASTTLPYLSASRLAEDNVLLLQSDQLEGDQDALLCGEKILRTLLKRRGRELQVLTNFPGVSNFTKGNSRARAVRWIYDLLHEDVWVNALDIDDFVIVDQAGGRVFPVVNLTSDKLEHLLEMLSEGEFDPMKRELARAILLVAGMKFNEAIDTLLSLTDSLNNVGSRRT